MKPLEYGHPKSAFNKFFSLTQWELVSFDFPSVVLHADLYYLLSTCGACSEVVLEFECSTTYFGSIGVKLILRTSWDAKMSLTLNELIQNGLIQPSHYLQECSKILADCERCCMQKNQFPNQISCLSCRIPLMWQNLPVLL